MWRQSSCFFSVNFCKIRINNDFEEKFNYLLITFRLLNMKIYNRICNKLNIKFNNKKSFNTRNYYIDVVPGFVFSLTFVEFCLSWSAIVSKKVQNFIISITFTRIFKHIPDFRRHFSVYFFRCKFVFVLFVRVYHPPLVGYC